MLSPEDLRRLDTLFDRAAELAPDERGSFLDRECGASGALRAEVDRLLIGLECEDLLARYQPGTPLPPGTKIGPYVLQERIGQGGMGEVYAADQEEPIRRRVALKIIKPGMDSAQVVARFHAERQALARMAHGHVA
jgi:serine/threonine protein kinase